MHKQRHISEVSFSGSAYERGIQRGRRLRDTLDVPHLETDERFVQGCYAAAREAYPPAIEEFEGLVTGGDFERDLLLPYYFARVESHLGGTVPGCTMFAVRPGHRVHSHTGPIAGRNYDWATSDLRWCELHRIRAEGEPRRMAYTHHWAGNADVLTDDGLYVAIASLPPQEIHAPGVQWNIVMEMLTGRCSCVAQAAEACADMRHLRPMSYLLADESGEVAVVEAMPHEVRLRRPKEGFVVAANIDQGGKIIRQWPGERVPGSLTEPVRPRPANYRGDALQRAQKRVDRTTNLLREGGRAISINDVQDILKDHEAPVCIGDHSDPDGAPWATIWSGICEPRYRTFRVAPGLPCRHPYQEFEMDQVPHASSS